MRPPRGMITITGGKLTTWRRMAKMTVDRLVERDARDAPCRTHEIPLGQAIAAEELPRVEGVAGGRLRRRSRRATATPRATCSRWPPTRGELAQPIVPGLPDLLAEVGAGGPPRAGAQHRRRAAAAHPARAAGRARAAPGADGAVRGAAASRRGARARARTGTPQRLELELERFAEEARAEGIVAEPAGASARRRARAAATAAARP